MLDDVLKKLNQLKRQNNSLTQKYNGDVKYTRIHKRIREENARRASVGVNPIVSRYDGDILDALTNIKHHIENQVYNRNDILTKDIYFDKVVMQLVSSGMQELNISCQREDRVFIQKKISKQYLDQYNSVSYMA